MDILGAIALGTEKYQKGAKFTRLARKNPNVLVLSYNWRQVIVHSLFQIIVMLFLMFVGQTIFFNGEGQQGAFNLINPGDRAEDRKKLDTICFHVFILMNLFNMINCRVLDTAEH
jgi:magnesium-transporting ATPase (P-type)